MTAVPTHPPVPLTRLFWVAVALLSAAWMGLIVTGIVAGLWGPWQSWIVLLASSVMAVSSGLWWHRAFPIYLVLAMGLLSVLVTVAFVLGGGK